MIAAFRTVAIYFQDLSPLPNRPVPQPLCFGNNFSKNDMVMIIFHSIIRLR